VRRGTGRTLLLLAAVAALVAAGTGSSSGKGGAAHISVQFERHAASSADPGAPSTVSSLAITGTPGPGRIQVFADPTGRLAIASPEGIMAPAGVAQCRQEGPAQISCEPGFLDVITADLLGGDDIFWAAPGLPVLFGATLDGRERAIAGGPGRDRIVVSGGADLIAGGPGHDTLIGGAGGDLVRGGPGRDRIWGGAGHDALFGNSGRDFLHGGPGKDLCNGAGGKDVGRSCAVTKKIP